jgi:hypothetical protein
MKNKNEKPIIVLLRGNNIDLTQSDLRWIQGVSEYLRNGGCFIMPSTFENWVLEYNGATVKVIKPAGRGAQPRTEIRFL